MLPLGNLLVNATNRRNNKVTELYLNNDPLMGVITFATPLTLFLFHSPFFINTSPRLSQTTMASPPKYTDNPTKSYGAAPIDAPATQPLLAAQAGSSRNAWMDQPSEDDLPDDFKVGVSVYDCDAEIRLAFIRKVYSILFVQLLMTSVISLLLSLPAAVDFTHSHGWVIYIPMAGSFASLFGVYMRRHQHPSNLILLGLFTIFESMLIGTVTSYYESRIVS